MYYNIVVTHTQTLAILYWRIIFILLRRSKDEHDVKRLSEKYEIKYFFYSSGFIFLLLRKNLANENLILCNLRGRRVNDAINYSK